jgi:hypothetical protein
VLWLDLYKSCVSETNRDKLEKLVTETEDAIFLRSCELSTEPSFRSLTNKVIRSLLG